MNGGVGGCGNVCFVDRFINRFRISSGGVHVVVVRVRVDVRVRNRVRVGVSSGGKVRVSFVVRFWMRIGVWICVRVRIQIEFFFFLTAKIPCTHSQKSCRWGKGNAKLHVDVEVEGLSAAQVARLRRVIFFC